jgi:hypothetical protein
MNCCALFTARAQCAKDYDSFRKPQNVGSTEDCPFSNNDNLRTGCIGLMYQYMKWHYMVQMRSMRDAVLYIWMRMLLR